MFEFICLAFAILDFAGWTEKLESLLTSARNTFDKFVDSVFELTPCILYPCMIPTTLAFGCLGASLSAQHGFAPWACLCVFLASLIPGAIISFVALIAVAAVIFIALAAAVLIAHEMSRAPRGMTGVMGLGLALASFITRQFG